MIAKLVATEIFQQYYANNYLFIGIYERITRGT